MLIVEVRIGPLAWCAVSGPPQRCWGEGAEPPQRLSLTWAVRSGGAVALERAPRIRRKLSQRGAKESS